MKARENPFRTERLHALAFRPQGTDWPAILRRLDELHCRAAIVGPKGSGKTTLMEELAVRLAAQGHRATKLWINEDSPPLNRDDICRLASLGPDDVLLFDGACHLSPLAWWRVRRATSRAGGLIITAHKPGRLPTLLATRTAPTLLAELIAELLGDAGAPSSPLANELYRRYRGDLRAALRELYDFHATDLNAERACRTT